ncbi:hypothetical protein [Natronoarchaeum rubrum]|uniref:hypothetical protein n=1 Tax=Natronoarchaeum rubrum TaxID=755311 RepID=UPI0021137D9F|nr:hypothetical protein [Natronoarchaeum rubrum]
MIERVYQSTVFALYQLTIAVGIVMMPLALAAQRTAGRAPPIHRIVERVESAYEGAKP